MRERDASSLRFNLNANKQKLGTNSQKWMNRNLVAGAIVGALVVIGSLLFVLGISTSSTTTSESVSSSTSSFPAPTSEHTNSMNDGLSYQVVKENATVYDQATLIPCEVIIHHCPTYSGHTSSTAQLIKYNGTYYYRTLFSETTDYGSASQSTAVYTIWYTNSSYYCISPTVIGVSAITCPP